MIRAALVGATGRMGQAIIRAARASTEIAISAAVASAQSAHLGRDAGEACRHRSSGSDDRQRPCRGA